MHPFYVDFVLILSVYTHFIELKLLESKKLQSHNDFQVRQLELKTVPLGIIKNRAFFQRNALFYFFSSLLRIATNTAISDCFQCAFLSPLWDVSPVAAISPKSIATRRPIYSY